MAIQVKKNGSYADVAGVYVKANGVYSAAAGVYAKIAGTYVNVGTTPLPAPTTVNYTAGQVAVGLVGSISTTKNAARIYGRGARTAWVGIITGTEAKLTATSEWGANDALIQVSVDGGAFSNATHVGSLYTLFTGLAHGPHLVIWRFGDAFGDVAYLAASGNILQVTGQPPSVSFATEWVQPGNATATSLWDAETGANTAQYTPPLISGSSSNSDVPSVRIRGAINELYIAANSRYIYVSKNGAAPTRYDLGVVSNTPITGKILTGLGGDLASYNIWTGTITVLSGAGHLGVSSPQALVDIGTKRRIDQFGDSITYGQGSTSPGDVEMMRVAAAIGFTGSTCGVSGYSIAQLDTLLTTVMPRRTVTSSDVAVIAIGRNHVGGAFDAAEISGYQSIISKLLTAGYGTVLCRGILPSGNLSTTWPDENGSIQSIVTGLANPNVKFVDTSGYPAYDTQSNDNTHPTDAGYTTLAPYVEASYRAALGL